MGIALGCIGMSRGDFERCTPLEFHEVWRMWAEHEHDMEKDRWERVRILASVFIQPYSKRSVKPKELLPLPWDSEGKKESEKEEMSKEEFNRRYAEARKRNGLK